MTHPGDRVYTGRFRVLQYVADGCIVLACATFAALVGRHWAWGPFVLAALLVAAWFAANTAFLTMLIDRIGPSDSERADLRSRLRVRYKVLVPGAVAIAIGFGLIAGSIPSYWPDLGLGVMILILGVALPVLVLLRVRKRAAAERSGPLDGAR